jgi:uncharacterized protein (UPF0276 family)
MSAKARLALAVSHQFARPSLDIQKLISLAAVLEIKTLPEPVWLPTEMERVFHWGYGLVEEGFTKAFDKIADYLKARGISLFSCDLGPAAIRRQGILPLSATLKPQKIMQKAEKALLYVRSNYNGKVAVENYNYFPTGLYEHICRPDFIGQFLEKYELGLVLDLAHAAISAWNLRLNFSTYLKELPLERVVEIHLSKPYIPRSPKALAADTHKNPGPKEFQWLTNALELLAETTPMVTVEYYNNIKKLLTTNHKILDLIS